MKPGTWRILFALSVLLFASLACDYEYIEPDGPSTTVGNLTCHTNGRRDNLGHPLYACTCNYGDGTDVVTEFDLFYNTGLVEAKICVVTATPAMSSTPSPTVTATITPSQTPTETPTFTAEPLSPILEGNVSVCDMQLGYINLPFVQPVPDLTGKQLVVAFNGSPANCSPAPSNPGILTCSLNNASFPLSISASVDGSDAGNFIFDGASCTSPTSTPERPKERNAPTATPNCNTPDTDGC